MNGFHGIRAAGRGGRRRSWPTTALLVLGCWLVVSPLMATRRRRGRAAASAGSEHPPLVEASGGRR